MRVISINVNGLRAAERKGFFSWLPKQDADVVCLQETRVQDAQLSERMRTPEGFEPFYRHAERPGYSGVAIYSRKPPTKVHTELGWNEADEEGRYLQLDFGRLSVVSLYLPSGSSSEARQAAKFRFMERFEDWLARKRNSRRHYVICGDWNIAHKEIDLKNWRGNRKNSGFLPEERAWMDRVFNGLGWRDTFRVLEPTAEGEGYTWWSNRGRAWENNVGWRIDYQVTTPGMSRKAHGFSIYKEERFSDHAPLTIDYHYDF